MSKMINWDWKCLSWLTEHLSCHECKLIASSWLLCRSLIGFNIAVTLSSLSHIIRCSFRIQKKKGQRDVSPLVWKMEQKAIGHGISESSRNWKRQGSDPPLKPWQNTILTPWAWLRETCVQLSFFYSFKNYFWLSVAVWWVKLLPLMLASHMGVQFLSQTLHLQTGSLRMT